MTAGRVGRRGNVAGDSMAPSKLDIDPVFLEAIENLPGGITIFDAQDGPILYNEISRQRFPHLYDAYEKLGAASYEEAIRHNVAQVRPDLHGEAKEEVVQTFCRYADTGETYEQRTPDGRIVQVTYRPMSGGRRVAISVDVTELRQKERELKRAKEEAVAASNAKSAFLANMSHEIRTPLNGILGMAQVLEMSDHLPEDLREHVATILDSGRNLMALLNDVLDLSKIEAGKLAIVKADTDLSHTMRRLHRLWKPKAQEAGLEFNLSLDSELPQVLSFDAVRVRQQGRVEVFVSAEPAGHAQHLVKVRVTDTGVGMDEETIGRLFAPFVQADDSTSRRFGGTGLGLSIVRRLCELMGGSASVRSEPGRGSEFTMTFLAGEAAPQHRVVSTGASEPDAGRASLKNQNLRVLLVDDHPINRQVAALFLRPFNIRLVEAVNGKEALACLEAEQFDLVLLDVHMPVMDGMETIRRIRSCEASWSTIPVIALTADAMSGDRERYLNAGMNGYLSKPLAERDLIAEISRVRGLSADELQAARDRSAA
jgi:signal transduction histidine kinase/ActR/RegA family two-component response regulator